mmetsp:Transcript_100268/g.289498  ORF Transcript_100268/g.289498 Transcript_100268/m.289498 type:complete len:224 (-) Transcript_100268:2204-2875(-)
MRRPAEGDHGEGTRRTSPDSRPTAMRELFPCAVQARGSSDATQSPAAQTCSTCGGLASEGHLGRKRAKGRRLGESPPRPLASRSTRLVGAPEPDPEDTAKSRTPEPGEGRAGGSRRPQALASGAPANATASPPKSSGLSQVASPQEAVPEKREPKRPRSSPAARSAERWPTSGAVSRTRSAPSSPIVARRPPINTRPAIDKGRRIGGLVKAVPSAMGRNATSR